MDARTALLMAAFWTAVLAYRGQRPLRFVAGLVLGAAATHLGWALLHADALRGHPAIVLEPASGLCVLFFPLGPLLLERSPAAIRTLPLALAVARAGCLPAGCCRGPDGFPTPWLEIAALIGLHLAVQRAAERWVLPGFLMGFGALRLAVEPLRLAPPLGEPLLPPALIALAWLLAGLTQRRDPALREPRHLHAPNGDSRPGD